VEAFVRECARVVKADGIVAIIDGITVGDTAIRHYVNAFEKLRDPSHVWQFSPDEWQTFFVNSKLAVTLVERYRKAFEFHDYCERMNVPARTRLQLKAMLVQAPQRATELFDIFEKDGQLWFYLHEVLIVGIKL
jgi:hypothetical protein